MVREMPKYMIVDDEPLIRKGLAKLITRMVPEWELIGEAWNGQEGLDMAIHLQPDLIFTDIRMPEMDGLDMSKHLIDQAVSIPIVFFTGHDEFTYIQSALKNNAFDYLLKPIKDDDIRLLFDHYDREFGLNKSKRQQDLTAIKQYEFYLSSALESYSLDKLEHLEECYVKLQELMNIRSFIELTSRTVNSYLLKHDIIGSEFKPVINENNASNVIRKLEAFCISQVEETKDNHTNVLIKKVKDWVELHIKDNPSLTDAAELIHLNPTYFSEYFKKHAGETFMQYVVRVRIQYAKNLLTDHSLRIYDIAELVGYTDQRHFSKVFQTKVGMTPTEYRNHMLGLGSNQGS